MRVVIQRSKKSSVCVDGKLISEIEKGLVLLVGFTNGDTIKDIEKIVKKIIQLRIFDDEKGVMNKSVLDIKGSILSVSQFTLYADTKKGNRPSYINALDRNEAKIFYEAFNQKLSQFVETKTGVFGADMFLKIENNGPVTIILDSKN